MFRKHPRQDRSRPVRQPRREYPSFLALIFFFVIVASDVPAPRSSTDDTDVHLSRDEHPHVRAPPDCTAPPRRGRCCQVSRRRADRERTCMWGRRYVVIRFPRLQVAHLLYRSRSDDRVEGHCQDRRREDAATTEGLIHSKPAYLGSGHIHITIKHRSELRWDMLSRTVYGIL